MTATTMDNAETSENAGGQPEAEGSRDPDANLALAGFLFGTGAFARLWSRLSLEQVFYSRRLSDKILIAFHHACDQNDFEVAEQLLHVLEMMLTRRPLSPDGTRRRNMESLVAAHERLWHLRHPDLD